ncbi:MAG: SH3 domain-containing protein [Patescibacteria group bacterium]|jgi:hypothetical protein
MLSDIQKLREQLKKKDREITELKELLAEAEQEIKELNDFHGFQKPKPSVFESQFLNKLIKSAAFILVCALIIIVGIYPWVFKDGTTEDKKVDVAIEDNSNETGDATETGIEQSSQEENKDNTTSPETAKPAPKQMLIVKSDLGWLNVRTEPSIETGDIIKKINSEDEYEWIEKTDNNWYKIKIDGEGHTGYVSGEYVELK